MTHSWWSISLNFTLSIYLISYVLSKGWIDEEEDLHTPSYEELANIDKEEDELEDADEFERKHNFRYEEEYDPYKSIIAYYTSEEVQTWFLIHVIYKIQWEDPMILESLNVNFCILSSY